MTMRHGALSFYVLLLSAVLFFAGMIGLIGAICSLVERIIKPFARFENRRWFGLLHLILFLFAQVLVVGTLALLGTGMFEFFGNWGILLVACIPVGLGLWIWYSDDSGTARRGYRKRF